MILAEDGHVDAHADRCPSLCCIALRLFMVRSLMIYHDDEVFARFQGRNEGSFRIRWVGLPRFGALRRNPNPPTLRLVGESSALSKARPIRLRFAEREGRSCMSPSRPAKVSFPSELFAKRCRRRYRPDFSPENHLRATLRNERFLGSSQPKSSPSVDSSKGRISLEASDRRVSDFRALSVWCRFESASKESLCFR